MAEQVTTPEIPTTETPPEHNLDKNWVGQLMDRFNKLRLADFARNMGNNQRIQNNSARTDKAYRERGERILDAMDSHALRNYPQLKALQEQQKNPAPSGEDDMQVRIDSPETIHNHYHLPPPEPVKKRFPWLKAALFGASLLATGGAGTLFALPMLKGLFEKAPVVQQLEDTDTDQWNEIGIWEEKK